MCQRHSLSQFQILSDLNGSGAQQCPSPAWAVPGPCTESSSKQEEERHLPLLPPLPSRGKVFPADAPAQLPIFSNSRWARGTILLVNNRMSTKMKILSFQFHLCVLCIPQKEARSNPRQSVGVKQPVCWLSSLRDPLWEIFKPLIKKEVRRRNLVFFFSWRNGVFQVMRLNGRTALVSRSMSRQE